MEQLVNEMKEVNLQSLTVTTSEEIKHLLEGKEFKKNTSYLRNFITFWICFIIFRLQ